MTTSPTLFAAASTCRRSWLAKPDVPTCDAPESLDFSTTDHPGALHLDHALHLGEGAHDGLFRRKGTKNTVIFVASPGEFYRTLPVPA